MKLNPEYTFDNFVIGICNQLPHSAALKVAMDSFGEMICNPLVIYGEAGVGKTHLLHSIGNYIISEAPYLTVSCFDFEEIYDCLVEMTMEGAYEIEIIKSDVYLVDGVYNKGNIFNNTLFLERLSLFLSAIQKHSKQIVIMCGLFPVDRFSGFYDIIRKFRYGLSVQMARPGFETREAIIRFKAEKFGLNITDESLSRLAEKIVGPMGILDDILNRLKAISRQMGDEESIRILDVKTEYVIKMPDE